tara:strand:+ start:322 stop:519 length:198 start_codon:yes stop_codon:yes gene_type:complete
MKKVENIIFFIILFQYDRFILILLCPAFLILGEQRASIKANEQQYGDAIAFVELVHFKASPGHRP